MTTNKQFQVEAIKRILKQKGIEPDLIDVEAYVDGSLTLSENARIIQEDLTSILNQKNPQLETKNIHKVQRFIDAIEIFDRKTNKQQRMDSSKNAKTTFSQSDLNENNFNNWKDKTNRYDIEGVDTKY